MRENTSTTVPGTTVKIAIMKTMEGRWNVTRTQQVGIARRVDVTFPADSQEAAKVFADICWTNAVDARNEQIARADADAYAGFQRAQASNSFIIEVRFDD
jgi:hypothetical protein